MKVGSSLNWMWMLSRGKRGQAGQGCRVVLSRLSGLLILYIESLDVYSDARNCNEIVPLSQPASQTGIGPSLHVSKLPSRRCTHNRPLSLSTPLITLVFSPNAE